MLTRKAAQVVSIADKYFRRLLIEEIISVGNNLSNEDYYFIPENPTKSSSFSSSPV